MYLSILKDTQPVTRLRLLYYNVKKTVSSELVLYHNSLLYKKRIIN